MAVKVEMNEPVVIIDGGRSKARRGDVVKIGRVWIEVQPEGYGPGYTLRFRLDTQTNGSQIGVPARFYTLDQWAEKQRRAEATAFLHEQGISIDNRSLWRGREIELAKRLGLETPS